MHEHYIIPVLSKMWWICNIGTFAVISIIIQLGVIAKRQGWEQKLRLALLIYFIAREFYYFVYLFSTDRFTLRDSLPLHMCGISYMIAIIQLWKPGGKFYEFLLLMGMMGAIQAFVTPELTHGYSPFLLIDYLVSHGQIILVPLYLYFVLHVPIETGAWKRVLIIGNVILLIVACVNYLLNANYIYLCTPPKANNPFIIGPFPYHIIGFEIFGFIFITLFYLLFKVYPEYRKLK